MCIWQLTKVALIIWRRVERKHLWSTRFSFGAEVHTVFFTNGKLGNSRVDYLGTTKTSVENSGEKPFNKNSQAHKEMFWTRLLHFLNQPNWALRLRTIYTRTTACQKGCVGCVNNGIGGNTCGPHGFLSVQRASGGVLSAFDYFCQLGNCAFFVPYNCDCVFYYHPSIQKGCVGCVNNGIGGNSCGPHGFLSVLWASGGVLSAFDYCCQLGNCAFFVPYNYVFYYHPSIQKAGSYLLVNLLLHP